MTIPDASEWLPEWDDPGYVYEPSMPTLRNYVAGYWATAFEDFEAAVRHWAVLYTAFGMESDDAVAAGVRWAMEHGYFPENYSTKPVRTSTIEQIKERLKVEDVAARLTTLRGNGKNLTGRCPFHDDRSPSFVVWPSIQKWRCYGCGLHGDVLDMLDQANMNE